MILTFNTACLDAIPAIVELVNESYRPQNPNASWTNESKIVSGNRINMAQAQDLIQNPESTLLLGFNNAELVSCVLVEKAISSAKISLLTVAIKRQQQGFGKQTLMAAEDYIANNLGLTKIKMHVLLVRGELIDFYCRLGYQKTGIIKSYPENSGVGKSLIEDLKFEILEKHLVFPVS